VGRFTVWIEGYEHESDAWEHCALDAQAAAEEYVEENYGDLDYPDTTKVTVVDLESGERSRWKVVVEMTPSFDAHRISGNGKV
jgi:hypothetical protein